MTLDEFWEHIQKSKRKDSDAHAERLVARLAKQPVEEILDFALWWDELHEAVYNWHMWGAAYLINGGCSDDGFDYFRGWLILRGRKVYEDACKNPDSLAVVITPDEDFCEYGGRPGWDAWFEATGTEENDRGYDQLFAALAARSASRRKKRKRGMGRNWDFDDEGKMRRRLPRLAALYLSDDADE